ncbi:DUF4931 domain-containing protein [Patescibacteria group bacterium]
MKEANIRQDYVHNRTVIVAPQRSKRKKHGGSPFAIPVTSRMRCPFEPERIDKVRALHVVGGQKKWSIKVIKNKYPIVSLDNPRAYGQQEVVIETPQHDIELAELDVEHISKLLGAYAERIKQLSKNKKFQYILVFKNNGGRAGATIDHAHTQIFASDMVPPHVLLKLTRAQEFRIRYGRSYYDDLIERERKGPRLIMEDEHFIALAPYASIYNYEAWILAKRNIDNITELNGHERTSLAGQLKKLLYRLDEIELPYNFYMHQVINFTDERFYLRIAPRRDIWAGIELGSRLYVNTVAPEEAAKFYRDHKKPKRPKRSKSKTAGKKSKK